MVGDGNKFILLGSFGYEQRFEIGKRNPMCPSMPLHKTAKNFSPFTAKYYEGST